MNFGYLRSDASRLAQILYRLKRRGLIFAHDIGREICWNLPGGRFYYRRNFRRIRDAHHWCFIVGCNNSGTSLLQKLLEASGEVSTLPYEGQLYTRVFARAMRRGHERLFTEYSDELRVDEGEIPERVPRLVYDWYRDLEQPVKRIILEKTPHNVLRMRWLQQAFPGCSFICLVRDGRAVAEGIMRKAGKSALRAGRHWERVHREMLEQLEGISNYIVVRYEDLCDKQLEVSGQLADFLQLDRDKLRTALDTTRFISNMDDAVPLEITNLNDRSLRRLTAEDLQTITEQEREMLDRFGYSRVLKLS